MESSWHKFCIVWLLEKTEIPCWSSWLSWLEIPGQVTNSAPFCCWTTFFTKVRPDGGIHILIFDRHKVRPFRWQQALLNKTTFFFETTSTKKGGAFGSYEYSEDKPPTPPRKFTSHPLQSLWPLGMSWFWRSRLDPLTFAIGNLAQLQVGKTLKDTSLQNPYTFLSVSSNHHDTMTQLLTSSSFLPKKNFPASQGRPRVLCQLLPICQVWMVISEQPLKLADSTR